VRHRGLARKHQQWPGSDSGQTRGGTWGLRVLRMRPVTDIRTIELGRAPGTRSGREAQVPSWQPGRRRAAGGDTTLDHRYSSPFPASPPLLGRMLGRDSPAGKVLVGDLNMPGPRHAGSTGATDPWCAGRVTSRNGRVRLIQELGSHAAKRGEWRSESRRRG